MKETMMTYVAEEYEVCRSILSQADDILRTFEAFMAEHQPKQWLILATGSSANAALSAKYYMEKVSGISVEIQEPFNFVHYEKVKPSVELVLAISQSGHSFSTIEAIKKVQKEGRVPAIALTANVDSPITKHADQVVEIQCGVEKVGFVTKGFTATVLTAMLMSVKAGLALGHLGEDEATQEIAKLSALVEQIPGIIEKTEEFYKKHASTLVTGWRFAAIGYGPTVGTAKECETKFTETIRVPTHGFELEAYMHGPYLEVDDSHFLFFIQTESVLKERSERLKQYMLPYTSHCFTVSQSSALDDKTLGLDVAMDEWMSPLVMVIPFQILSYRIATGKGIDLGVRIFDDFDKVLKSKV